MSLKTRQLLQMKELGISDDDDSSDDLTNDDDDVDSDADGDNEASDSEKTNSDEDENPNLNQNDDEEEEYKEEYVRTPENYEFTNNDEEYEELYKDVNVRLKDTDHEEEGKGDAKMTDAGRADVSQEKSYEQVKDDAHVTLTASHVIQKTEVDNEVISMMNFKVRHEEPSTQTQSFLTIHVTIILKTSTAAAPTIPLIISLIPPLPQQSTLTPTHVPTTETTTTSILALPYFSSLFEFDQRVSVLEKELSQLKQVDYSAQLLKTIKSQIPAMVDDQLSTRLEDSIQKAFWSYTSEFEKKAQGTCKSRVELEYHFEEWYKAVIDRLDWNNPEGQEYPFDLSKPLLLIEDRGIKDMVPSLWSLVKVAYDKYDVWGITDWGPKRQRFYGYASNRLYKFKEGDFPRLNLRDIEDMLLLLVQKKISNLERDVIFDLNVALRMFTRCVVILKRVEDLQLGVESYQKKLNITKPDTFMSDISKRTTYTTYKNPQGIIYVDTFKRNRLIRLDELYKFSDGTLTSVRNALHDIASNPRMDCVSFSKEKME
ncbi:hypothetical protein Tco_0715694 [Tanacetum coccineum]